MKGINILVAAILAVTQFASAPAEPAAATVDFGGLPIEQVEIATWAIGLYAEADLELPPVRFEYHGDDTDVCDGWLACHETTTDGSVIAICTSRTDPGMEVLFLHELAHAWCAHSLADAQRRDFQHLRDWSTWRGAEVHWHQRGTEQAAEILMWGLIDRPTGVITITDHGCDALEAGYRTLTGDDPLHGHRDHC